MRATPRPANSTVPLREIRSNSTTQRVKQIEIEGETTRFPQILAERAILAGTQRIRREFGDLRERILRSLPNSEAASTQTT